ncbi:MAG: SCO family protein [Myxococcaceae bacterium]|nr:SCO family protein [Myxococcaceae bacterium]
MRGLSLTLLLALGAPATGLAAPDTRGPEAKVERVAAPKLTDELLLDQDGNPVRLASELLHDKVVVVNFVFSTCSTICSPMSAVFSRLRKELGDAVGLARRGSTGRCC